eukprot:scaffold285_cov330-Pavlova_lutheri.AAC.141
MAEMDANETHRVILESTRSRPRVMLDVREARRCTRRNPYTPCNRCQSEGMERCECHGSVRRIRSSVDEECKEDQQGIHVWAGGAVDGRNRWYPNAHLAVGHLRVLGVAHVPKRILDHPIPRRVRTNSQQTTCLHLDPSARRPISASLPYSRSSPTPSMT